MLQTNIRLDRPIFTGEMMLSILQEIMSIGNKHVGVSFLGTQWQETHQNVSVIFPALKNWSVDSFVKISCCESILLQELTDEDIQGLTLWIQQIVEEGERINPDFRKILNASSISLLAKYFLEAQAV
jgi:hypothetical protein